MHNVFRASSSERDTGSTNHVRSLIIQGLNELRTAIVQYCHGSELSDGISIYSQTRRMPRRYRGIIREELQMIMGAGINITAIYPQGYSVTIAKKREMH